MNDNENIEAPASTTMLKLKKWLIDSYIDVEHLRNVTIRNDLKSIDLGEEEVNRLYNQEIKNIVEKYVNDRIFMHNFVDFYISDGIVNQKLTYIVS